MMSRRLEEKEEHVAGGEVTGKTCAFGEKLIFFFASLNRIIHRIGVQFPTIETDSSQIRFIFNIPKKKKK